jgi:hypothetical protein
VLPGFSAGSEPDDRLGLNDFERRLMVSEPKEQSYTARAEHCEQMALRVKDPEARHKFVELAKKWRSLAREAAKGVAKTEEERR